MYIFAVLTEVASSTCLEATVLTGMFYLEMNIFFVCLKIMFSCGFVMTVFMVAGEKLSGNTFKYFGTRKITTIYTTFTGTPFM